MPSQFEWGAYADQCVSCSWPVSTLTDTDGQIFSWIRADSSGDPVGPHIDFPGGKVDLNETLLQAAHREHGEELSPYGPDLRDKVEATMNASPNGHSRVWVELAAHCSHQIMIWGIETSRAVSLSCPFKPSEPFISLETHKNLDARWRSHILQRSSRLVGQDHQNHTGLIVRGRDSSCFAGCQIYMLYSRTTSFP